jgi:two-component system, chemotaxis family, protein-glutamate methylesterase/glutaminase
MVKVLIVDDSLIMRQFLAGEISKAPDMEIVGMADNPYSARDAIVELHPDVVTLDIEMPSMDGLTFLNKLMRYYPLPVIVVSSYTMEGSDTALHALKMGAVDVLGKPGPLQSVDDFRKSLVDKIRGAAQARCFNSGELKPKSIPPLRGGLILNDSDYKIIAVGASIGGTEAIRELLMGLPGNSPGIMIVQHLPEPFTKQFTEQLDADCDLEVRIARTGDQMKPGLALVCPGGRHLVLSRRGSQYFSEVRTGPSVHGHCPSVDVLFHSVAAAAGQEAIGILLTGMGCDGAQGLLAMRQAGARTFAQDKKSCVVFGMPKVAIDLGAVERVVPLDLMAQKIISVISQEQVQSNV